MSIDKSKIDYTDTESHWWDALQYQCPSCKEYLCFKFDRENETHYWKKCAKCSFERANLKLFADYRHENGKVFLRSNVYPEWTEVELRKVKKGIKVMPVVTLNNTKPVGETI